MSDNYEKDMALTLQEALSIINSVEESKIEISTYEKTISFILQYQLKKEEVVEIIRSLNEKHYIRGPIPDNKTSERRNKPVWIFKKNWDGIILYIKIKIFITNRKVLIVSIHEDETE